MDPVVYMHAWLMSTPFAASQRAALALSLDLCVCLDEPQMTDCVISQSCF